MDIIRKMDRIRFLFGIVKIHIFEDIGLLANFSIQKKIFPLSYREIYQNLKISINA